MFDIVKATVAHQSTLIQFAMFRKLQDDVFSYVNPLPVFMYQFESIAVVITTTDVQNGIFHNINAIAQVFFIT